MSGKGMIDGYQRAALMRQAHTLNPVATIGRNGLTQELRDHIDRELDNHELIKIRFGDYKGRTAEITDAIANDLSATVVATIGHVGILFRQLADPQGRSVHLPMRGQE